MKNISDKMKKFEKTMDDWSNTMDEWADSFDIPEGEETYSHTVHTVNGRTRVVSSSPQAPTKASPAPKQRMSYVEKADLAEMIEMQVERGIQKHMNGVYVWLIVSLLASFTSLLIALCAIY